MNALTYSLNRKILLEKDWDVIVAGGGPAGCAAAAASARAGARTLLIEQTQSLGGSGTTALVPAWCPFSDKEKIIYRGLAERVLRASLAGTPFVPSGQLDWVPIQPEHLKRVYDDMMDEFGVVVRFQTFLGGVELKDHGRVGVILVSDKGGLRGLSSRVFIDCTGDGDLAAWAGAEFQKRQELQPATHCFLLSNVNETALARIPGKFHGSNPDNVIHRILASGRFLLIPDSHLCMNKIAPGVFGFNAGHLYHHDNTSPEHLGKAPAQGRRLAESYRMALAELLPEVFGQAALIATGAQVGVRETRRITGDYILTIDDWLNRSTFADEICRNAYFIDLHMTAEEAKASHEVDVENRYRHYSPGESHGIPFRCLIPRGLNNVLVAGRNISCDANVHGSIRVMPVCLAMGEAAGHAASMAALSHGGNVRAVDPAKLRERLRCFGAWLP